MVNVHGSPGQSMGERRRRNGGSSPPWTPTHGGNANRPISVEGAQGGQGFAVETHGIFEVWRTR